MLSANTHTNTHSCHTGTNTYQTRGVHVPFNLLNALILREEKVLHAKTHCGKNIIKMSGFMNEPHIYFTEKDASGKEEITDVYSGAKHLGCLTGNSPIHPFHWCVSLHGSTPQSLPDSPLGARKTNLTTGDKLPKGQKTFQQNPPALLSPLHKYFPAEHDLPCAFHFLLHLTSRKG